MPVEPEETTESPEREGTVEDLMPEKPEETTESPEGEGTAEDSIPKEPEETAEDLQPEILYHVTTREDKVALRSTPEFKMDGSNVIGIIREAPGKKSMYKVIEVKGEYGKLIYPEGAWISLKACEKH